MILPEGLALRAAHFYEGCPTGQYDDEAAHALRSYPKLVKALEDACAREYNPFEPRNQSKHYKVLAAVLKEVAA